MKNAIGCKLLVSLLSGLLLTASGLAVTAQICSPAPVGLVSWWAMDGNFSQDFAGDLNGIISLNGTHTLQGGQLRSTGTGGDGNGSRARINIPPAGLRKISTLVTVQSVGTEGPELTFGEANGPNSVYVDYFQAAGQLRLVRNVSVLASTPVALPPGVQTTMSLEFDGTTFTGKLGAATVSSPAALSGPYAAFIGGYLIGESGLFDDLHVTSDTSADLRSRKNGTLTGSTPVTGENGQGLRFGPADDMVADGSGGLDITGSQITIEAWVKLENNPIDPSREVSAYIGKNNFPTESYALMFEGGLIGNSLPGPQLPANQWQVEYILTNSSGTRVHNQRTGVFVTVDGNYHHFAVTYDGSGAPSSNVRIYVDGVLQATNITNAQDQITGPLKSSPATPFSISSEGTAASVSVDEVSVYDRALLGSEITSIAASGQAGKCKPTATLQPSGLIAWFGGDGDANDLAGWSNASLQNGTAFTVGKVGQSFDLDGIDDSVAVPATDLSFGTNDFSIDLWFNLNTVAGDHTLFNKLSSGTFPNSREYEVEANNGNTLRFLVRDTTLNENDLQVAVSLQNNTWYHVVGVRAGNTSRLYLDGVQVGLQTAGTNIDTGAGGQAFIGRLVSSASRFVGGKVDELSLYNRALTETEVFSIFNAGVAGKLKQNAAIDTSSLVSLWQGEGNANDTRGANNGTYAANSFAAGRVGQAFSLTGVNQFAEIGDSISTSITGEITLEAWIRPADTVGTKTILSKYDSNAPGLSYFLGLQGDEVEFIVYGNAGGSLRRILNTTSSNISTTGFTHVATSFNPGDQTIKIYVNGLEAAATLDPGSTSVASIFDSSTPVRIGAVFDTPGGAILPFSGVIDEAAIYSRVLTPPQVRANYEAGNALSTVVGDARITFGAVTSGGETQEIPLNPGLFPPLPMGVQTGLIYDIATSAGTLGSPSVCFNLPAFTPAQFADLQIMHLESGSWVNRTAAANVFPILCSDGLTSLSPIAIARLVPSAAGVSVGGRVLTANGSGLRDVRVTLVASDTSTRSALTNAFGFYRFDDIQAGETYVISVQSKRYQFAEPTRVLNVTSELSGVDFTASPLTDLKDVRVK